MPQGRNWPTPTTSASIPTRCWTTRSPSDGEYVLEIQDSIYRGREDFVYRIEVGRTAVRDQHLPAGRPGRNAHHGRTEGLEPAGAKLAEDTKDKPAGHLSDVRRATATSISNRVPFAVDTLPEALEKEPNDRRQTRSASSCPSSSTAASTSRAIRDVFRFEGRAGEEIVAEVTGAPARFAARFRAQADRRRRQGTGVNDDHEDKGAGLLTHHADSRLRVKLPANGTYYLHLGDAQRKGGPDYAYRLRISHPQPDFELRVAPSSINARAGATVPITVYALRRDGFSGEIDLKLKDAPAGFRAERRRRFPPTRTRCGSP